MKLCEWRFRDRCAVPNAFRYNSYRTKKQGFPDPAHKAGDELGNECVDILMFISCIHRDAAASCFEMQFHF
jgi:hypothetical protein